MTDTDAVTRARKAALILQHPDETPEIVGLQSGCVSPPSRFRENARWLRFRDQTVIPCIAAHPDDPNWPRWLARIEEILAWRGMIPPEDRFWRPDERTG